MKDKHNKQWLGHEDKYNKQWLEHEDKLNEYQGMKINTMNIRV